MQSYRLSFITYNLSFLFCIPNIDFYNAFYVMKGDFWMPRKNFVYAIQYHFNNPDIFAYLMWQYSNRDYGIKDYMQRLTERKIMDLIKEKILIEMEEIDDE